LDGSSEERIRRVSSELNLGFRRTNRDEVLFITIALLILLKLLLLLGVSSLTVLTASSIGDDDGVTEMFVISAEVSFCFKP